MAKLAGGKSRPREKRNLAGLFPSYQKHFVGWIVTARRPETRAKRVKEAVGLLAKGEKLWLK
ncbi:MAG TPA: YdeI/OmpD-associated family protein [Verrucomicrobiae bacterium]|nr:YdeI/OmpD-associated family protein [Verrucomicrobiae bacterium]